MRRDRGPRQEEITTAEEIVGPLPTTEEALREMEARSQASRSAASVPCKLFVGGLSWDTDEATLRAAFEQHGAVAEAVVLKDRATGSSRGFGFVTMADRKDASKAIAALHGSELDGRTLVVNVATAR